jgi:uncharacterized protein (DUF433 family)
VKTALAIPYIALDARGRPVIDGTTVRVEQIVLNHIGSSASPQQLAADSNLTLSQIYAAMLYYYEHQKEMDEEIERGRQQAIRKRDAAGVSAFVERLNRENPLRK